MYLIKELADLAGVSTRTLRHYHQLGLLVPAAIGDNGYRYYSHENLLRLQQVLFFRELSLPLQEIRALLDSPEFEPLKALRDHRQALKTRAGKIDQLLFTLDRTISYMQGEGSMTDQELFSGFNESLYEDEVRERWGDTPQYRESERKWSSYTSDQKKRIKEEGGQITRRLVPQDPQARPGDPAVQGAVEDYYHYLNQYFYTFEVEFLRELAEGWVQDPRFAINYERLREGGAAFAREAVKIFCDRRSASA